MCMYGLHFVAGGGADDGAGSGNFGNVRANSRGRDEQFEDYVAHSRDRGRVRAARDGDSKSRGGGRLGREDDGVMGIGEHAFGAVDISAAERGNACAWMGEHGAFGGGGNSVPWAADGGAAGVDAKHERSGHRPS